MEASACVGAKSWSSLVTRFRHGHSRRPDCRLGICPLVPTQSLPLAGTARGRRQTRRSARRGCVMTTWPDGWASALPERSATAPPYYPGTVHRPGLGRPGPIGSGDWGRMRLSYWQNSASTSPRWSAVPAGRCCAAAWIGPNSSLIWPGRSAPRLPRPCWPRVGWSNRQRIALSSRPTAAGSCLPTGSGFGSVSSDGNSSCRSRRSPCSPRRSHPSAFRAGRSRRIRERLGRPPIAVPSPRSPDRRPPGTAR